MAFDFGSCLFSFVIVSFGSLATFFFFNAMSIDKHVLGCKILH